MYETLLACSSCGRHVRAVERSCPFCGTERLAENVRSVGYPRERLTRAALILGTSIATATFGSPAYADIGPPEDASVGPTNDGGDGDAGAPDGGPDDGGTVVAVYGAPASCDVDVGNAPNGTGYMAGLLALGVLAGVRRRR